LQNQGAHLIAARCNTDRQQKQATTPLVIPAHIRPAQNSFLQLSATLIFNLGTLWVHVLTAGIKGPASVTKQLLEARCNVVQAIMDLQATEYQGLRMDTLIRNKKQEMPLLSSHMFVYYESLSEN
jgi:hypothetical protein